MNLLFTLLFSACVIFVQAQNKLNVSGSITIADVGADSSVKISKGLEAIIEIRKQEKNEDISMKVETDGNGKYEFKLPYYPADLYYVSVVSLGCPTKQFVISTYGIDPKDSLGEFNPFVADIELYKIPEGKFNVELYNSPMNQFYFDEEEQNFTYDEEYIALTSQAQQLFKESIIDFKQRKLIAEQAEKDRNMMRIFIGISVLLGVLLILMFILHKKFKRNAAQRILS